MTGKTSKLVIPLIIKEMNYNLKKNTCNNWRKMHKLPKIRRGK